jgi:hypothetical protein
MKKNWLLGVLVILLLACSGLSSPVTAPPVEVISPTPLLPVTSTPVIITPTFTANPEPPPTTQTQTEYRPFSAIIARVAPISFYLLGGTENGELLHPETVVPHLSDEETYQLYNLNGPEGSANGMKPMRDNICPVYWVNADSDFQGGLEVGVTGAWDVTPRIAQEIPTDHATYIEAVEDWLMGQNISEPVVEISQILRVDIEGDGTEEVLISASHFVEPTGHSVEHGDYSLVVMRKVVGNSVVTVPVVADYYYQEVEVQFPLTYALTFPADLNNDGDLEILVGVERWEGSGVIVYEVDGMKIWMVFEVICGL